MFMFRWLAKKKTTIPSVQGFQLKHRVMKWTRCFVVVVFGLPILYSGR